jgi:hypothetical protein
LNGRAARAILVAMNVYVDLTREFNAGQLRAILCSGQAVVLHRLAVMSKDGDWILREREDALAHVLEVLDSRGARYRFGAPLDVRWMAGGWSAHFEFRHEALRVRTDFFTRPPRITAERLGQLWQEQERNALPFVGVVDLAEMKKTNRERDYPVIGELARLMTAPRDQLLYSRSAQDLLALAEEHPALTAELAQERPVLAALSGGRDAVEAALDAERRRLIHANEERLAAYMTASEHWAARWPEVQAEINGLPLREAHAALVAMAEGVLPVAVRGADDA